MASSLCKFPSLAIPQLPDLLAAIVQLLASLGITLPSVPTIPLPPPFCPLD